MTTGILKTDCDRIVDADGDAVLLRGVSSPTLIMLNVTMYCK
jgi:hypothetical protein